MIAILKMTLNVVPTFIFSNRFPIPENKFAKIISADANKNKTIPTTTNTISTDIATFLIFYLFIFSFFVTIFLDALLVSSTPSLYLIIVFVINSKVLYK